MKRFFIDLALKAFRSRQSQQTGYVHFSYENHELSSETIPFYENALFALALFRSRLSDDVLEGRELIQKLLHFRVTGNFPIYLHEYPACKDRNQPYKILPILVWLLREFPIVLGEELKKNIHQAIDQIMANEEPIPKNSLLKKEAYLKKENLFTERPKTATDLRDYIIALHLYEHPEEEKLLQELSSLWDPHLMTFIGEDLKQDHLEPQVTHFDFFMGQLFDCHSPRWNPSLPIAMHAALVPNYPYPHFSLPEKKPTIQLKQHILFGDASKIHSLQILSEENTFILKDEEDRALIYIDNSPEHRILVNGERATVFQLSDTVEIRSKELSFTLRFHGNGSFLGRISKANRPSQAATKSQLKYAAFDHQISIEPIEVAFPQTLHLEIECNAESEILRLV